VGDGEARKRYILVNNPEEAERDKANRERALLRIREELERIGELNGAPHTKACCRLIAHETYGRYLKTDRLGQPRIDKAKIKVLLCWMALLLIRVAETKTGKAWRRQRRHLQMCT